MNCTLRTLAATIVVAGFGAAGSALGDDMQPLPAAQVQGAVSYVTGGIGEDQAAAFRHAAASYPLEMLFVEKAGAKNEFLADVSVSVRDRSGTALLETTTDGPFLLAELPDGKYSIDAEYRGEHKHRSIEIRSGAHQSAIFVWAPHDKAEQAASGSAS